METSHNIHDYCVILAGGQGARFWPLSREEKPKQFIDFFGMGRSLLQQTFDRMQKVCNTDQIYILTQQNYVPLVQEQIPEIPVRHILPEPMRRNTAPAVVWAVLHIYARDPNANVVVVPSDQVIMRDDLFVKDIDEGLEFVEKEHEMLTIAVKPTRPETNYGYIQISDETKGNLHRMKSFVEKPELEFAKFFVESGEFYWNTAIFLWNVKAFLHNARELYPEWASRMDEARPNWTSREEEIQVIQQNYGMTPNLSIDAAMLEKSGKIFVKPCSFGWVDMGNWENYYDTSPKDHKDNVIPESNAVCYDCTGNIIHAPQGKYVVADGLKDFVVIDNPDLLVICPRKNASKWKKYVNDVQINLGDKYI